MFSLAGALLLCSGVVYATPITYDLTGVTTNAGSLTGTVSIDSGTGRVTAADITFNDDAVGDPVFSSIGRPNSYNLLGQDYISGPSNSSLNWGGQIALYYDISDLGSDTLPICLLGGPCGTEHSQGSYVQAYVSSGLGGPYWVTGGTLTQVSLLTSPTPAATPEPRSLLLLGTGIILMALLMARMSGRKTAKELAE
ncbi:MAG TPA: hypothetical protein VG714_06405 [Acidobacteriaceae bacterium]|nr:hypothetical protein [Acidobacteriaceae bacterium]